MAALENAFVDFIARVPFYGKAVVCGDDPGVRACLERFTKPFLTYGFSSDNDYWIENHIESEAGQEFSVFTKSDGKLGTIKLRIHGKHNALNALSTVCVGRLIGLDFSQIQKGLQEFAGVRRRFDVRYDDPRRKIRVVDDYGHHPTEIEATLKAARSSWKNGRIRVVFQPHRYSRTLHCESGFLGCFSFADELILTEIYSAGEDPIPGVTGENLFGKIKDGKRGPKNTLFAKNLEEAKSLCLGDLKDGDLLLCMGAGSITRLPDLIIAGLST
jgi:UDP-N-acetylmuramate--alanine ligase